jgi:hypothetical protein
MRLLTIFIAALFVVTPEVGFAKDWRGYLVNSQCYDAEERSINPFDTSPEVDRDRSMEVGQCTPNLKTKSFAIVDLRELGLASFKLDSVGNAKAKDLVRRTGKKSFREVVVNGQLSKNTIDVNSISDAR